MPGTENDNGDFKEYRRLILSELESLGRRSTDLDRKIERVLGVLNKELIDQGKDISKLKGTASAWGGIVGGFTGAVTAALATIFKPN